MNVNFVEKSCLLKAPPEFFDAIIIGGGPAGMASAIALAMDGIKVALIEKSSFPVDKPCGQGIMPTGVSYLKELGVFKYLSTENYSNFYGIKYFSQKGKTAEGEFPNGPGLGMRRVDLSNALFRRTQDFKNLKIMSETKVKGLKKSKSTVKVFTNQGNLSCRLLIAADGLKSRVRKWTNLEAPKGKKLRWGVRQHFEMKPWNNKVEVYWQNGLEAYITPCASNTVEVAFLWEPSKLKGLKGGKDIFESLLSYFPQLQKRLQGSLAYNDVKAIGPFNQKSKSPITDGVLLIGDAAGYLDAITGEGISLALAQASALRKHVSPILKESFRGLIFKNHDQRLAYLKEYKEIVNPYYFLTGMILKIAEYPALVEKVVFLLSKNKALFNNFLMANMGLEKPFSLKAIAILFTGFFKQQNKKKNRTLAKA